MKKNHLILVVGATGGVGQLTVAKLINKGWTVRLLTRNSEKAQKLFNNQAEIIEGDLRQPQTLPPATFKITHLISCVGTTAFPSDKWELEFPNRWNYLTVYFNRQQAIQQGKNSPQKIDAEGIINLINACPNNLQRFVLVSSCGVLRKEQFPFKLLNLFGVLDAKKQGEDALIKSGIPYTIIRPARLIDGPFTSYDLNSLLQATTAGKKGVVIDTGERISGETSRLDVANACVECLFTDMTKNKIFEIVNRGERTTELDWNNLWSKL